jgi:hypothetical protein
MLRKEFGQTDTLDEVIDQGQRPQALATKDKAGGCSREGLHAEHSGGSINARIAVVKPPMSRRTEKIIERAHKRIAAIREALGAMELLCSGTLLKRMTVCGKPGCRCASDPAARHGPYYEWGHMHEGRLVHRVVSPQQAEVLRGAIANHRTAKKLMKQWESETERLMDANTDLNQ